MGIRSTNAALIGIAFALFASSASAQAGTHHPPGTKVVRNGEHEAVLVPLEAARAAMSDEERELLDLRQQMRQLRAERREAIRSARESGDPAAMARVQEEFRPRLDALREQVRDSRDVVMEQRLRENPELAERLGARRGRRGGREQVECGRSGHADDTARRRAFRRLRAIAPEGTLVNPSDIPTPVREELTTHARRVALLQCIRARARSHSDTETSISARRLIRDEQRRHDRELRQLFGLPSVPEPVGRIEPAQAGAAAPAPATTTAPAAAERPAAARGRAEHAGEEEGR
jgi:hypothetical protein